MSIAAIIAESVFKYGPLLLSTLASIWQDKEHGAITLDEAEARIKEAMDFADRQRRLDDAAVMKEVQ